MSDSYEICPEQQKTSNSRIISNEDDDEIFLSKLSVIQKEYEVLINRLQDLKKLKEEQQASLITLVKEYANNIKKLDDMYKKPLPIKPNDRSHKMLDNYKTSLETFSEKVVHLSQVGFWGYSKSVKEVEKQKEQIKAYDGVIQAWLNIEQIQPDENIELWNDCSSKLFHLNKEYEYIMWTMCLPGTARIRDVERSSICALLNQFCGNVGKLHMDQNYASNYLQTVLENYLIKVKELSSVVGRVNGMLLLLRKEKAGKEILEAFEKLQGFDLIIQSSFGIELRC